MITAVKRWAWNTRYTALVGLVLSLVLFNDLIDRGIRLYDRSAPIVEMQGTLIAKDTRSATIHITGRKVRDCKFVRINAYYQFSGNGMLVDAFLERINGAVDGSTKPVGEFDLGLWRIWPTDSASKVLVFVHHECGGPHPETVLTKIAEVTL